MIRQIACFIAAGFLTACTTFQDMDAGLSSLHGQPAQAAFAKLGYPKSEGLVAGRKFYVWSTNFDMAIPVTTTASTYGSVGTTPYSGRTTSTDWQSASYDCTIRVFVDENEVITSTDYAGNIGGCEAYGRALKR